MSIGRRPFDNRRMATAAAEDVTVLLIEDHLALRKGIELLLRTRGFHVVGVSDSAEQGYRLWEAHRPDVAIIDMGLGEGSGVALAERILALDPGAGVLIYSGLRIVAAGGVHLDSAVASLIAPSAARSRLLTNREREILGLLSTGMTGEQIAEKLFLSPETVRTHIRNAMRKLGAKTRVQAVVLALRLREISTG
jgi:DNA-binding NarL/FixJ family response regulator